MRVLDDGMIEIRNKITGEKKVIKPSELGKYGLSLQQAPLPSVNTTGINKQVTPSQPWQQQALKELGPLGSLGGQAQETMSRGNVLPTLGAMAGGVISVPGVGAGAGAGFGELLRQALEKRIKGQNVLQSLQPSGEEVGQIAVKGAGYGALDLALAGLGKGLGWGVGKLKEGVGKITGAGKTIEKITTTSTKTYPLETLRNELKNILSNWKGVKEQASVSREVNEFLDANAQAGVREADISMKALQKLKEVSGAKSKFSKETSEIATKIWKDVNATVKDIQTGTAGGILPELKGPQQAYSIMSKGKNALEMAKRVALWRVIWKMLGGLPGL